MKGLILAAGRGSRMHGLTDGKPKGLIELNGMPLVDYQILALHKAGIETVGFITGYRAELYQSRADRIFLNDNWQNTNMVASLCCASSWLKNETCLVSYSDIVYTDKTVRALTESVGDIVITYDPNWNHLWSARFSNPLEDCETFLCNEEKRLLEIGQRPERMDEVKGQYTGLFKITPSGWKHIKALLAEKDANSRRTMDMTRLLSELLKNEVSIQCCPVVGDWGEIDTESDLQLYESWIREGKFTLINS